MKLIEAIDSLGKQKAKQIAKKSAMASSINWDGEAKHVFKVIVDDPSRVPGNIGGRNDSAEAAIEKWVKRYRSGLDGRASKRLSKLPGTVADPIIEKMIGARLDHLSKGELNKITFAHRVSMSAENILGLILEEYLSENLKRK